MADIDNQVKDLQNWLLNFSKEAESQIQDIITQRAKEAKDDIKSKSPVGRRGKYSKSWKIATNRKDGFYRKVVHSSEAGLTHLLENGHVVKNQFGGAKKPGKKSRTKSIPHILPVQNEVEETIYRDISSMMDKLIGG